MFSAERIGFLEEIAASIGMALARQLAAEDLAESLQRLQETQAQLTQADKLAAVGTLAGGIAHDFNNILAVIFGYSEMLRDQLTPGDKRAQNISQILKAAHRARDLVNQILIFSRQEVLTLRPIEVGPLLKETAKLLRASLPATIDIHTDIEPGAIVVLSDPTQIHQVMMNLCTNAAHAMRNKGGRLEIRLFRVTLESARMVGHRELEPGAYMKLVVADTGQGIDPTILERIYEPFFTTKSAGEGTGLGLSVVLGIVQSASGAIAVESEPGVGTRFEILIPLASEAAQGEHRTAGGVQRGTERILLIDDEEALSAMWREILRDLGYDVLSLTDSLKALELFRANPAAFDIAILDQTMPNMTGIELARQFLALRPDLPIILCTGFSESVDEEAAREAGVLAFHYKPIVTADLATSVRRLLDGRPARMR